MAALDFGNPVFVTYAIVSAALVLKVMGQGWMTVYRMLRSNSGLVSPEDIQVGAINKSPDPSQLEINDYVDRSRRMHRNDLENIPAFWAVWLLYVLTGPALWLAQLLMYGFLAMRLIHAVVYATKQTHEVRATFYTVASLIVIYMACAVLWALLGA